MWFIIEYYFKATVHFGDAGKRVVNLNVVALDFMRCDHEMRISEIKSLVY